MSSPFKTGDKVVRLNEPHDGVRVGTIGTVGEVFPNGVRLVGGSKGSLHQPRNLRAAIAGQDYDYVPEAPFKFGDKVECRDGGTHNKSPMTVTKVALVGGKVNVTREVDCGFVYTDNCCNPKLPWRFCNIRPAAAPAPQPEANSGHLPDGSGVQKHSAGAIYPCVITLRDKRLKGTGLFDYGLTSPRNPEPLWFSTLEAAHVVADIINKDIEP